MTDHDTDTADEKAPYTKLVTKVKRGTGTRDQDTTKVVTRHPDPHIAVQNHRAAVESLKRLVDSARGVQPGEGDDG